MFGKRPKRSLTPRNQKYLTRHFVTGESAWSAAELSNLNLKALTPHVCKPRELISDKLAEEGAGIAAGVIEVVESYFGGVRKSKRGRGVPRNIPVFVHLKRGGRVYAVTITNARSK